MLALVALAACAAAPAAGPAASGPDGDVRLVVEDGPLATVSVVAEGPAEGTYTLVVERGGAAGRSRAQQGGAFRVAAGAADTLSVSRVNTSPGDTLRATLEVEWSDGRRTEQTHERVVGAPGSDG